MFVVVAVCLHVGGHEAEALGVAGSLDLLQHTHLLGSGERFLLASASARERGGDGRRAHGGLVFGEHRVDHELGLLVVGRGRGLFLRGWGHVLLRQGHGFFWRWRARRREQIGARLGTHLVAEVFLQLCVLHGLDRRKQALVDVAPLGNLVAPGEPARMSARVVIRRALGDFVLVEHESPTSTTPVAEERLCCGTGAPRTRHSEGSPC
mmetsp:Transcript_29337/g.78769  ORF Transcript_29337/g.78769 Transcript_29337/m.78769 type:complete len:208 (+) Transcript_29337:1025-1648(+)